MKSEDIKQLRKELGWSQTKMARYFGVTATTIMAWEKGENQPPELAQIILVKLHNELKEHDRKQEFIAKLGTAAVMGGISAFLNLLYGDKDE